MKNVWTIGSAAALALSVSIAWAQAPAPKGPPLKGDPKVGACVQHNQKEHAEIMAMHNKAVKEHKISGAEEKEFRSREGRLRAHQAALAKGGLTLAECEQITKDLNTEKAAVARMAATPVGAPPVKK